MRFLAPLLLPLLSSLAPAQSTWFVDGSHTPPGTGTMADPYVSIQAAIASPMTLSGDDIVVEPGTYLEALDYGGKDLDIASTGGPALTTIDANGLGSVVTLTSGEGGATRLAGFTLTGGTGTDIGLGSVVGGGVLIIGSTVRLEDCNLTMNAAPMAGQGLYASGAQIEMVGCTVEANGTNMTPVDTFGGGVYAEATTLTIEDSLIEGNFASAGGGLYISGGLSTWTRVTVRNNSVLSPSLTGGGGLNATSGTLLLDDCSFTGNTANFDDDDGGAVYLDGALLVATGTEFIDNAADEGGALYIAAGSAALTDCTLADNIADAQQATASTSGSGGAAYVGGASATFTRCLFTSNRADGVDGLMTEGRGGAVFGGALLERCTLVDNTATLEAMAVYGGQLDSSIAWGAAGVQLDASSAAVHCNVQGGFPGMGNFDADPRFCDPAAGDFALLHDSPCFDTGNPAFALDADGSPADVGASSQRRWTIDALAAGPGNGTVADPYLSIQAAIDAVATESKDTLFIQAGTYLETLDFSGKELMLVGVAGAEATTIDAVGLDRVVSIALAEGEKALVQGLRLTGGDTTGDGGGLLVSGGTVTLLDLIVEDNYADGCGKGLHAALANVRVENCIFRDHGDLLVNLPGSLGGAIGFIQVQAVVTGCTLENNFADRGAGLYAELSTLELNDSAVRSNSALTKNSGGGGGLHLVDSFSTVSSCLIELNDATFDDRDGGGAFVNGGTTTILDTQFEANEADQGGGLYLFAGTVQIEGSRFYANHAFDSLGALDTSGDGGGIYVFGGTLSAVRTVFASNEAQGNFPFLDNGKGGAVFGPASLVQCTFFDNFAHFAGGSAWDSDLDSCIARTGDPDELGGIATAIYSNIQGTYPGVGNLAANPLFWAPPFHDFHLRPGSVSIDTGNPALPLDGDGSAAEQGAFPFTVDYCPTPEVYCAPAPGPVCTSQIGYTGTPTLASGADDFHVTATQVPSNTFALLIWGVAPNANPFFGSTLCVANPIIRTPLQFTGSTGGSCGGSTDFLFSQQYMASFLLMPFTPLYSQYWHRAPGTASGIGLSDALRFTLCP